MSKHIGLYVQKCFREGLMFYIEWLDQFNRWNKYSSYQHLPTAYKSANNRAKLKKRKHRILDNFGRLVDVFEP